MEYNLKNTPCENSVKTVANRFFTGRNSITTEKMTKALIFQKLPIPDKHSFPEILQSLSETVPLGHLQSLLQKLETTRQTLDTESQCSVVPDKDCLQAELWKLES